MPPRYAVPRPDLAPRRSGGRSRYALPAGCRYACTHAPAPASAYLIVCMSVCAVVQTGVGTRRVALEEVMFQYRTQHAQNATLTRNTRLIHILSLCTYSLQTTHHNSTTTWMRTQVQQLADPSGLTAIRSSSSPRRILTTTSTSRAFPRTLTTISM